jgi:hypothetical protein
MSLDAVSRRFEEKKGELWTITTPLVSWIEELKNSYSKDKKIQRVFQ